MGVIKKAVKSVGKAVGLGGGGDAGGSDADAQIIADARAAQATAQAEANRIAAEAAARQQELNNINKNYATDLTQENRALVEAGGTANDSVVGNADQKRRRASTGLASTLGINV